MPIATKSKTKAIIPRRRPKQPNLFRPPLLLVGEDAAAYEELYARIRADVKPVDTVDEMFVEDVVYLQWEVLRGRRLKTALIREYQTKALRKYLWDKLDFSLYAEEFSAELASFLEDKVPAGSAEQIADAFVQDDPDATSRVKSLLSIFKTRMDQIVGAAQRQKAEELAKRYGRREPDVVKLVDEILSGANVGIDELLAEELVGKLDIIEHIDRLTAIFENRRNMMLGEIDRRRGEALRRTIKQVEDVEFQDVTPAKGKH